MCEFCRMYQEEVENGKILKNEKGIDISIRIRMFVEVLKNQVAKSHVTYRPTKLLYCPECGRKLVD